ncbi:MAG: ABC transporter transmembrane domain-containing protein [Flavobacteriales bacterium]|nr:ABC transporter transmembrane domain-containing protein [Flavobacteriales bacterium]MCW8913614.1 ABC transporter transmembrane domain-containing protein [Flavobacteriales bacterium]MCW8937118.1 ABC transporter transmembrane domain-containing protein [Flavobacteriales bacterium]MCW8939297.1 ABC transporter transmembrane domain-containing protein [Flavobacteriales bacterium]MCW8969316.1 ABC transporter transmembrane domain-containing protein [Flavobacteriales bacterium]
MAKKKRFSKESIKKAMRVFRFIKPFKIPFIIGLLVLFISSITTMVFPKVLGDLIDSVNADDATTVNTFTLLLVGIFLVTAILSFLRVYLFGLVTYKALALLRMTTYKHLISSPMSYFSKRRVGELSSRITSDIALLQDTFTTTIAEFLRQFITIPVGMFFLLFISFRLTVFMIAVIPVVAIIGVFFGKYIKKLSKEAQDDIADANTVVDETLHGIASVKAYANEFFEILRYKKSIDSSVSTSIKRALWRGVFIGLIMFAAGAAIVSIIWYGLHMVQNEVITLGELLSFAIYSALLGFSFAGAADLFSQLQKAIGATENLMDILDETTENVTLEQTPEIKIEGNLVFNNVCFSYPSRRDIQVLKGITFNVEQGKQIAIVGPSGSGKSTIAGLIFRFYDPESGEISIDGKNINDYALSQIRNQMAIVPQEVMLFGGTIKENIEYGKPNATDEEIFEAAKKANALEFIESFPEKFETLVGDRGIQLSGGQKQRIAIARAILKDPSILVLDEATSALDSESERLVQEALERLMEGRTSIVIAHRLSTIKKADTIIVLDNGKIKEKGTHEELVKKENGIYKNLSTLQLTAV